MKLLREYHDLVDGRSDLNSDPARFPELSNVWKRKKCVMEIMEPCSVMDVFLVALCLRHAAIIMNVEGENLSSGVVAGEGPQP
jgi:hypothetical protein